VHREELQGYKPTNKQTWRLKCRDIFVEKLGLRGDRGDRGVPSLAPLQPITSRAETRNTRLTVYLTLLCDNLKK
jgi:hypothetical protein